MASCFRAVATQEEERKWSNEKEEEDRTSYRAATDFPLCGCETDTPTCIAVRVHGQFSEMGRADRGGAILNGHHSISACFVLGRLLSCRGSRFGMNHDGLEDGGLGLLLRLHRLGGCLHRHWILHDVVVPRVALHFL